MIIIHSYIGFQYVYQSRSLLATYNAREPMDSTPRISY